MGLQDRHQRREIGMNEFHAGRIDYFGPEGETGREWFESIAHAGGRTLRAFCEMDDIGLTRDATFSLDVRSRPTDAYVRIIQNGQVKAATLFLVEPDAVVCEGVIARLGRLSQRKSTFGPAGYLGLHPLAGDALVTLLRDEQKPGEFITIHGVANSGAANGDEGHFAMSAAIDVAYIGQEEVAVAAGTFVARRYALRWRPEWPPADIWVHGPLAIFLRLTWELTGARFELATLRSHR
jgi:hypothetical protein